MWDDGDNSYYIWGGAVIPENPEGGGRFLLSICFENLFSIGALQTGKLMGLQTVVTGIGCQILDGFLGSFITFT